MGMEKCTVDEVMVVSGLFHKQPHIQKAGFKIVLPGVQKFQKMSLKLIKLDLDSRFVFKLSTSR